MTSHELIESSSNVNPEHTDCLHLQKS